MRNSAATQKLRLNILTPRGVKFEREADFLMMRAIDGDIGILPNHAPMTACLGDGILSIVNNDKEEKLALFEGVVEVRDNTANIYTTIAQRPEEIDLERARQDKEDAEAALQEAIENRQMQASILKIRQALVRIEVAIHTSDQGYLETADADSDKFDDD